MLLGTGLTGCGAGPKTEISATSAAHQIAAQLTARYGLSHVQVTCPPGVTDRDGQKFVCPTVIGGMSVDMDATVTGAGGHFTVAPAEPIVVLSSVAGQLATQIDQRTGRKPAVTCPGGVVKIVPVDTTFDCTATFPGEKGRTVTVKIIDIKGDFGYQLAAG